MHCELFDCLDCLEYAEIAFKSEIFLEKTFLTKTKLTFEDLEEKGFGLVEINYLLKLQKNGVDISGFNKNIDINELREIYN